METAVSYTLVIPYASFLFLNAFVLYKAMSEKKKQKRANLIALSVLMMIFWIIMVFCAVPIYYNLLLHYYRVLTPVIEDLNQFFW